MARKKTSGAQILPIRHSNQIKEDHSRLIFEASIPWMISSWIQRDFGIDATIEITKSISHSKDQIATGKRFSVQLKSSGRDNFEGRSISLSVPREKITYWFNAIEPILLVFVNLDQKQSYYRWIDEQLIKELFDQNETWIAQENVTVYFNKTNQLSLANWPKIEEFVLRWKRPNKTILTPGNYFHYSNQIKNHVDTLQSHSLNCQIHFLEKEIFDLTQTVAQPIYTIAIVGPSRSGKSTLINALLRKEVSPIGMLPTTGIPITIFPKNENSTTVVFKDGTEVKGAILPGFIEEFTSQRSNPENKKGVKLVSVSIVNTLLEKGFALCDVPGLDDPDGQIRAVSKTAIYNVNAIIYVVNLGPMGDGGFSITKQIIDDLSELSGKVEKLFLVFNKIDLLNESLLGEANMYINTTLERYGILKCLPAAPFYISSKKAFESRKKRNAKPDSVSKLEDQLWTFLLSENKTGLNKLLGSYSECKELIEKLRSIVNAKLLDSEKRKKVESEIEDVKLEIDELKTLVAGEKDRILREVDQYLQNSFENIISFLKKDLESIAVDKPLAESKSISLWLENHAFSTMSACDSYLQNEVRTMQAKINQWIKEKLKQIEINLETEQSYSEFKIPEISYYTSQINPIFDEEKYQHPGILEKFLIILIIIGDAIVKTVDTFITSGATLRRKKIKRIHAKAQETYTKIRENYMSAVSNYFGNVCKAIEAKAIDRANIYLSELLIQLTNLNSEISLSQRKLFATFLTDISEIERQVASDFIHLREYTDGVIRRDDR